MILDPDYARIFTKVRCIAWSYGYACMAHGSYTRDLDLLLVPWESHATNEIEPLVNYIASSCDLVVDARPASLKPHGRTVFTLKFNTFGDPRFIDLGIMPVIREVKE